MWEQSWCEPPAGPSLTPRFRERVRKRGCLTDNISHKGVTHFTGATWQRCVCVYFTLASCKIADSFLAYKATQQASPTLYFTTSYYYGCRVLCRHACVGSVSVTAYRSPTRLYKHLYTFWPVALFMLFQLINLTDSAISRFCDSAF